MYNAEWVLLDVSSQPEVMFKGSALRASSAVYWCRGLTSIGILTSIHVEHTRPYETRQSGYLIADQSGWT